MKKTEVAARIRVRETKKALKRNTRYFLESRERSSGQVPPGDVRADFTGEIVWRTLARVQNYEGRQRWIARAGWDPAGWVFLNWNQLPHELKFDLVSMPWDEVTRVTVDEPSSRLMQKTSLGVYKG